MRALRSVYTSKFVRGGFLFFIITNVSNFGNLLYSMFMGRLLGPVDYGNLGALFSLLAVFGVPLLVLSLLVIKVVTTYWGEKRFGAIKSFMRYLTPRILTIGIIGSVCLLLLTQFFTNYLALNSFWYMAIIAVLFLINVINVEYKAVLIGMLEFNLISVNSLTEMLLKLIISVVLVMLQLRIFGALLGPVLGLLVGNLLAIIEINYILRKHPEEKIHTFSKLLVLSSFPTFLATLSLTLLVNTDIIFTNHFLPEEQAGYYVALSNLGKIIYYLINPIISIFFPYYVSRARDWKKNLLPFVLTMSFSFICSLVIRAVFRLFPSVIVDLMFGKTYMAIIPLISSYSFFITLYTLNAIITHFFLSISYYKPIYVLSVIPIIQSILLWYFHQSIKEVIWINTALSVVFLVVAIGMLLQKEFQIFKKIVISMFGDIYDQ